jgi:hypothetical protein
VLQTTDRIWIRWQAASDAVLRCLLPVPGLKLYAYRDGFWYRHGCHLPSFDLPREIDSMPLHQALTPAPVQPQPAGNQPLAAQRLRLVRDDHPRAATALRCQLADLAQWADTATSAALAAVQAAHSGKDVLLLGRKLPLLPSAERFWGERLLVPLGFRPEPLFGERILREALQVADNEIMILSEGGAEVLPREVLQPLTRSTLRLVLREQSP